MRLASAFALFASAFAVFPALAGPASAVPAAAPPLWSKALALAAAQESLVPGKIVMHQELRSRSGELEHFGDTTLQVVPGKDGDVRAEVAAASEDGKDVTAEARRRIEEALVGALGKPLRSFPHHVAPVRYQPATPEGDG